MHSDSHAFLPATLSSQPWISVNIHHHLRIHASIISRLLLENSWYHFGHFLNARKIWSDWFRLDWTRSCFRAAPILLSSSQDIKRHTNTQKRFISNPKIGWRRPFLTSLGCRAHFGATAKIRSVWCQLSHQDQIQPCCRAANTATVPLMAKSMYRSL